jgi:polyisoprenoid-binding protein YceI
MVLIYFEGNAQTLLLSLLFVSKEIGLKISVNKTKNMIMYQDQDAGRSDNLKIENSSFGIV